MKQPLRVTAAIIWDNDKVLLIKRARDPYKNYWCFVGGCGAFKKVNKPIEAVKIEVKADLNCKFNPRFFQSHRAVFEVPTNTYFYHGNIEGKPKITPKYVVKYRWFNLKEASRLALGFDHNLILNNFIKKHPFE